MARLYRFHRRVWLSTVVLVSLTAGCESQPPPGTPENLKADLERLKQELAEQKKSSQEQIQEHERVWTQRISDKDVKIADLTAENANLRQRLLSTESALNEVPLVQAAETQRHIWVHVIYILLLLASLTPLIVLLWVHANLRERVRMYVLQTAHALPVSEIDHEIAETR